MSHLTNFTVLIARRALKQYFRRLMAMLTALALLTGQPAMAVPGNGNGNGAAK